MQMSRTISEAHDVPFLPRPNTVRLVLSSEMPPEHLIATSMGLVFSEEGFLMTNLRARGWDIPGGHLEPGESPLTGVLREVLEETGYEAHVIDLFAHQIVRVDGPVPTDWSYPIPEGYQLFYLARVGRHVGLEITNEVTEARIFPIQEARRQRWVLEHSELFEEAWRRWQTA